MGVFREIFAWWTGNSWGNRYMVWRHGRYVGADDLGNRYFQQRRGVGPLGKPRRWVVYTDLAEPSKVSADWHGWLHHTVDRPPTEERYQPRPWQKPHRPNLTGTPGAHRPTGSTLAQGRRPKATGDYKAWNPGVRN